MAKEYGGHLGSWDHGPATPMDEFIRNELARRAACENRPEVRQKREADAASRERQALERNAKRKRPKLVQSTDYAWLKSDWVEAPVRPFRRR